jgi:hypothetical protein
MREGAAGPTEKDLRAGLQILLDGQCGLVEKIPASVSWKCHSLVVSSLPERPMRELQGSQKYQQLMSYQREYDQLYSAKVVDLLFRGSISIDDLYDENPGRKFWEAVHANERLWNKVVRKGTLPEPMRLEKLLDQKDVCTVLPVQHVESWEYTDKASGVYDHLFHDDLRVRTMSELRNAVATWSLEANMNLRSIDNLLQGGGVSWDSLDSL